MGCRTDQWGLRGGRELLTRRDRGLAVSACFEARLPGGHITGAAGMADDESEVIAEAAKRLGVVGERSANGLPTPASELAGDVAAVLRLTAKHAQDRSLLRASQHTLSTAVEFRTQHLRRLKDVLTTNRRLEEKICAADAQIAAMQAQNDELEAELLSAESAKPPPAAPLDGAGSAKSAAELLAQIEYMDACALKIQRVCRGWLGRRRALRQAMLINSGSAGDDVL